MDDLEENTGDCAGFKPNKFKKDKCQVCNLNWRKHKGIIDDHYLQEFLNEIRQKELEQKQKEDEAKAKARQERKDKKKQARAVEDDWLFDNNEDDLCVDSDDEDGGFMGLQMMVPGRQPSAQPKNLTLKVTNLIDWSECDVPEVMANHTEPPLATPAPPAQTSATSSTSSPKVAQRSPVSCAPPPEDDLLAVIEDLKQMLHDAKEEKTIQVAIVRDEVAEKQQLVEQLMLQRQEAEAALAETRAQLEMVTKERDLIHEQFGMHLQQKEQQRLQQQQQQQQQEQIEEMQPMQPMQPDTELRGEVQRLRAALAEEEGKRGSIVQSSNDMELVKVRTENADLRAEIQHLRSEVSPHTYGLLDQMDSVCMRTLEALHESTDTGSVEELIALSSAPSLEGKLRILQDKSVAIQVAAERKRSSECRHLIPDLFADHALSTCSPEDDPSNVLTTRRAAQMIKELRITAEKQLAWLSTRVKVQHPCEGRKELKNNF